MAAMSLSHFLWRGGVSLALLRSGLLLRLHRPKGGYGSEAGPVPGSASKGTGNFTFFPQNTSHQDPELPRETDRLSGETAWQYHLRDIQLYKQSRQRTPAPAANQLQAQRSRDPEVLGEPSRAA